MFAIIGILVVFGAVVGGYLMEKGNLLVLLQPAELLIIGGAAVGTLLIANPPHILSRILKGLTAAFTGSKYNQSFFLKSLKMLYDLFDLARRSGLPALEAEIENPAKGKTFAAHAAIIKDQHIAAFVCDSFRTMMLGGVDPFDFDQMLERETEINQHEESVPIAALTTVADSLPGLGIVAAVLGVVLTMGALGGPPEEIGHKVAAALVGTFLGILLCYGLVGPLSSSMAKAAQDGARVLPRAARLYVRVQQGAASHPGGGNGEAHDPAAQPADVSGNGDAGPEPGCPQAEAA